MPSLENTVKKGHEVAKALNIPFSDAINIINEREFKETSENKIKCTEKLKVDIENLEKLDKSFIRAKLFKRRHIKNGCWLWSLVGHGLPYIKFVGRIWSVPKVSLFAHGRCSMKDRIRYCEKNIRCFNPMHIFVISSKD